MTMEKTEIRAVIKYFVKKGMKVKEIHADFQNTLGDYAPHIQLLPSGPACLNLVGKAQMMIRVVDG